MNQAEFYLANQVNGELTDAQTMHMLGLPEGDSTQVQSSEPAAAADVTQPVAEVVKPVEAPTPVIVAKDGVHTIPFEKLAEAREAEQHWKRVAIEAQQALEAQKAAPVTQAQATQVESIPLVEGDVFGDYSEEAIAKGVEKLVNAKTAVIQAQLEAKFATVMEPLQKQQVESATDAHFNAINAAHPDVESVVQSAELAQWIASQPSFVRAGYQAAIAQGTATEVIEALDAYKAATGRNLPAAGSKKLDVAAAAQAAIAKAQSAPPMSLSEIPAGTNAHLDEAVAMLEMSDAGIMSKFDGKSPEQIMALLSRVI